MNGERKSKISRLVFRFGRVTVGFVIALVATFSELFATVEVEGNDERRIHDSDLSGELNYRTGRLDSGTDPYGWYDED